MPESHSTHSSFKGGPWMGTSVWELISMRMFLSSLALVSAVLAVTPANAQRISSVRIIQVSSNGGGVEDYPTTTPATTVRDHDGNNARVKIREIGIGTNRIVKMAGDLISPGNQISTTALCGSASSPSSCRAGQQIIGYDVLYSINGYPNGQFEYRVRSASGTQEYTIVYINVK